MSFGIKNSRLWIHVTPLLVACLASGIFMFAPLRANAYDDPSPQLVKALSYKPMQSGVKYELVKEADIGECSIEEKTRSDGKGFWVTGPNGQPLRWFADTTGNSKLNQWSYFNGGIEVYREIDTNGNKVADQFRWLSTEGMRHGSDPDENGEIDKWLVISPEEVTAEVVRAASDKNADKFSTLLISDAEIDALGLSDEKAALLRQRAKTARSQFRSWASGQSVVSSTSRWTNFGADKPGVVPAGTDGSKKDVVVYENAVALIDNDGQPKQLLVGTLVRVDDAWRIIDLPKTINEGTVVSDGVFFSASFNPGGNTAPSEMSAGITKAMERLVRDLQDIDAKMAQAGVDKKLLHARRADVLEKLVSESSDPADRTTWIQQFADTVSAAAQVGDYPKGVDRMGDFASKLQRARAAKDDIAYVVFRKISAENSLKMMEAGAEEDYEKNAKQQLQDLKQFVKDYPNSDDAAEAMIQIGLAAEFSGESKIALDWYTRASRGFEDTLAGQKAKGAVRRLRMKGQDFRITGTRIDGGAFDSNAYLGGPVIYHGWASWCGACEKEMQALRELQNKYAKSNLRIVGINFDREQSLGAAYLKKPNNSFPWVHLYEKGGLEESQTAIDYGFLSLPVNVIVDGKGKVVATGVYWTEFESVIEDLVK